MKIQSVIVLLNLALTNAMFGADPVPCGPEALLLVGRWPADGTPTDAVSTNHAMLHGGASFGAGLLRQSFCFGATNDTVTISAGESWRIFGNVTPLTIEFWFRPTVGITAADTQPHALVSVGSSSIGIAGSTVGATNGGYIQGTGPLLSGIKSVTSNWGAGTWHHVALTWGPGYRLFIDGVLESAPLFLYASILYGAPEIILGATSTGAAPFAGCIDELTIYSRALSPSEIWAIYEAGTFVGTEPHLVAASMANCVVASWPSGFTNFAPQAATNLDAPISWSDITNAVFTIGVRSLFMDTAATTSRFYKLRRQD